MLEVRYTGPPHIIIGFLFHNTIVSGFDAHFLLRYLAENKRIPELIQRGLKILSLECMGVRVIDSYSFLPQSLGSLPKTFNEPELCKGKPNINEYSHYTTIIIDESL